MLRYAPVTWISSVLVTIWMCIRSEYRSRLLSTYRDKDEHGQGRNDTKEHQERRSSPKLQQIIQSMFLLLHDAKDSDQDGSNRDQRRPDHRSRSERIAQNQPSEEGVEDEGDCAEGGEDDDGECVELEDGGEDVGGDVDPEPDEP